MACRVEMWDLTFTDVCETRRYGPACGRKQRYVFRPTEKDAKRLLTKLRKSKVTGVLTLEFTRGAAKPEHATLFIKKGVVTTTSPVSKQAAAKTARQAWRYPVRNQRFLQRFFDGEADCRMETLPGLDGLRGRILMCEKGKR